MYAISGARPNVGPTRHNGAMSDVPEFGRIPSIDEDPVYRLNVIASPLGHTVEWEGELLRIRPTGAVHDHHCQHLSRDLDDAKRYLDGRASHVAWTLDMQDPRYIVERPDGGSDTLAVVLVDAQTGRRHPPIAGGVTSGGAQTPVTGFYVTTEKPPNIGRWYR